MYVNVRPYPWFERFRVAAEVLVTGKAGFRGELRFSPDQDAALQQRSEERQRLRR